MPLSNATSFVLKNLRDLIVGYQRENNPTALPEETLNQIIDTRSLQKLDGILDIGVKDLVTALLKTVATEELRHFVDT